MTNKVWMVACSAILGFATTAMTQTAPPAQSSSSSDRKIAITGCLAAAPASSTAPSATGTTGTTGTTTTGTTGTTGTTADSSPAFQLTNATAAPADASGTTAGATTDAASAATGQTYRLMANPTALSPHVGKKLALTGTLEEQAPASASTTTSASPDAKVPTLRVESGKILAESCTQQ